MFTNSKLAQSVKLACAFGAVSSLGFAAPAIAQDAGADEGAVEKIQVTGSRIRRADIEGANPVSVLDAIEIEKFGITSIGDVLQSIPAAGSAINTNNNNGGNGTTTINIRGIGSNRTLVLVNGKRWSPGLGGSVDLNNIPSSIIERIEVLKDGASAVYGSDAIAGVVNIITKQDFDGLHASAYQGEYISEGDGNKEQYDIGFGASNDKGNVYFNVSYVEEEPTFAGDRAISAVPVFGTPDGFGGSSGTPEGRFFFYDNDGFVSANGYSNGAFTPWDNVASRFNFAPLNYLSTPQERTNIYTQGRYELTDNVSATATAFYGNRKSAQLLAPTPLFMGWAFGEFGYNIAANNPFNPTGLDLNSDTAPGEPGSLAIYGRRMLETGYRQFSQNVDQFQFNGGFEGVLELGDSEFYWDVGYTYADIAQNTITDGLLNTDRVKRAIGDVNNCVGADDGCVPLDLFGGATAIGQGTITQEMIDYISFTAQDAAGTTLESYAANITGDVVELPAGFMSFAAGYEKRWQSGYDQPDALIAAGITSGNSRQPTEGSFSVEEFYLELAVPLVADIAFVEALDLELATRYSDYSNFGDTTNSKVGVKWRVNEELMVRGTWSEAFRAPSISELFLGNSDSFPPLTDPCNGSNPDRNSLPGCAGIPASYEQPNSQIRITVGGNENLNAEEAESFTYGVVYAPTWLEGASLTFDVFDIEVEGAVSSVGAQSILDACAQTGVTLCSLIERGAQGNILDIFNGLVNLGGQTTKGFDMELAYNFETDFGDFKFRLDATYVDERSVIVVDPVTGTSEVFREHGRAFDRDVVPRIRSNISLNWVNGDWTANYLIRHIGHTVENCSIGSAGGVDLNDTLCNMPNSGPDGEDFNELGAMGYHDVSVGYFINDNLRVTAGINNLLDQDPPVSFTTFANSFDPSMYEVPGQFGYVRFSMTF
ncbi:TonB-dependent receptor domain-containing protein [Alteromonas facilis]|uniref:TonB-dependent receptor domain-containing protein n=1 Tax=Alteromonas facilis TaxID=2048004 RepID=UPI000C28834B|nr:TonB-dependent receptor [Alteromonas facilis]